MRVIELDKASLEFLMSTLRGGEVAFVRKGKPVALLGKLDLEEFEDRLYESSPAFRKRIRAARQNYRQGKFKTLEEIKKLYPANKHD